MNISLGWGRATVAGAALARGFDNVERVRGPRFGGHMEDQLFWTASHPFQNCVRRPMTAAASGRVITWTSYGERLIGMAAFFQW